MTATTAARNQALVQWYREHRRTLPWREEPTPWFVLVSEVMAQQTQVERVADRFGTFVAQYPTPATLADAPPAEVLLAWSGLGYNRRALRLREAAAGIAKRGWPRTVEGLRALPGVGPYTAAAVACFAFGQAVPAVDTNLRRVLQRWHGSELSTNDLDAMASGNSTSTIPPSGTRRSWTWPPSTAGLGIPRVEAARWSRGAPVRLRIPRRHPKVAGRAHHAKPVGR